MLPSLRQIPKRRLQVGSTVYPWGNPARAKIVKHLRRGGEVHFRVKFIEDNIATIHWWMQLIIFPRGYTVDLDRSQVSDHPQR
jgi:hypothetical protein